MNPHFKEGNRSLVLRTVLPFLFFLFYGPFCFGQIKLIGVVVSSADGKPIAGASVYVNNTSIGVVTDGAGRFELTAPGALAELVVSHVGYEKVKMGVENGVKSNALHIELKPRNELMDNVSIRVNYKETWKKWGRLFTAYLVGETGFAKNCTILNPEAVRFRYHKNTKTVIAKAKEVLLIENKALGYLIHYELDSFAYCFTTDVILRKGTNFNEVLTERKNDIAIQSAVNRLFAYQGSMMHLMRSVFKGSWREEGFSVYTFHSILNEEKQRVLQLVNRLKAANYEKGMNPTHDAQLASLVSEKDSQNYYAEVLTGPNYFFKDSVPVDLARRILEAEDTAVKTVVFSSDTFLVRFDDTMDSLFHDRVKWLHYYQTLSRRFNFVYPFFPPTSRAQDKFSILLLDGCCELGIDANGSLQTLDAPLFSDGFIGWKKIAYQLPLDYDPERDKRLISSETRN